jgi:UDP-N-acetylmuramate--alanine ligase
VIAGFNEFVQKVPADGLIVCDPADEKVSKSLIGVKGKIIDRQEFYSKSIKLMVPGEHNRLNAATAIAVAKVLGVETDRALKALETFSGAWRRFEYKGKTKSGALIYDDYAHNPQKVKAALQGAREMFPEKRIVVVFQPHLFSRTKLLLNEFAAAFTDADEVILAPIFPAREVFDSTISSEILAEEIKKHGQDSSLHLTRTCLRRQANRSESSPVRAFPDFVSIENYLKSSLKSNDVLITMGAGEQYKIGEELLDVN